MRATSPCWAAGAPTWRQTDFDWRGLCESFIPAAKRRFVCPLSRHPPTWGGGIDAKMTSDPSQDHPRTRRQLRRALAVTGILFGGVFVSFLLRQSAQDWERER